MIIFQTKLYFQKLIDSYCQCIIVSVFSTVCVFTMTLMASIFFILNFQDGNNSPWNSFIPIPGNLWVLSIYWYFFMNRRQFNGVLGEMQSVINESSSNLLQNVRAQFISSFSFLLNSTGLELNGNRMLYLKTEEKMKMLTNAFIYALCAVAVSGLSPFAIVAYHLCLGTYSIDSWFFYFNLW